VASDSLNENYTKVVINVNDKNDLPPVFSQNVYTAELKEECEGPHPHPLLQVRTLSVTNQVAGPCRGVPMVEAKLMENELTEYLTRRFRDKLVRWWTNPGHGTTHFLLD